jgi:ribosomal protein S18
MERISNKFSPFPPCLSIFPINYTNQQHSDKIKQILLRYIYSDMPIRNLYKEIWILSRFLTELLRTILQMFVSEKNSIMRKRECDT